jgi:hypothetical protein
MAAGMPMVGVQLSWAGGKGPSDDSGGKSGAAGSGPTKPTPTERKSLGNQKSFIKSNLGINVGVSAMLKQSQIFTGVIGTIFQLIGALVDVILAPFLPIVIPAIKLLAAQIPIAARFAQKIFEVLQPIWAFFQAQFEKLPTAFGGVFSTALSAFFLGSFMAKLFGVWGPWMSIVKLTAKGIWASIKLVLWAAAAIAPAVNGLAKKILGPLATFLWEKIGAHVVTGLEIVKNKIVNLLAPLKSLAGGALNFGKTVIASLGNKIATLIPDALISALKTLSDNIGAKLLAIFPTGWKASLGEAIAKAAKSGIKKLGGFLGKVGLKGAGAVLTGASKLPARDELGRFAAVAAKKPGVWSKAAKAIPLLSTAVTAGMAVHRTAGAVARGDLDLAAAYATAGVAFTVGQLAADLSSVTGVGLAASGALAVAEYGTLKGIDAAFKDQPAVTNQDAAQNAMNTTVAPTQGASGSPMRMNGGGP